MRNTVPAIAAALLLAAGCSTANQHWAPAGEHIRTAWADQVNPSNVHPEYPRPQMVRSRWKSLNGLWSYAVTPAAPSAVPDWSSATPDISDMIDGNGAMLPDKADGSILVPFCIESSLSGVGRRVGPEEVLWYSTSFKLPKDWNERILLHFDAVDWLADVWVNGAFAGRHVGGYTAFSFDITPYLVNGTQHVLLRVVDGTDNDMQPRGKQVSEPGGIWYTPVTGIWQSVWIEPVAEASISSYNAIGSMDGGLDIQTVINGEADEVRYTLLEGGLGWSTEEPGNPASVASCSAAPGKSVRLEVADVHLWSPEEPYLYGLRIELVKDGATVDSVLGYTAFRESSEVRDSAGQRRLGLNGKPYFQFGPLDQGWWPDGLYTAPSDEALKYDIATTKELGYNMIRKHIKVEPARWYWYCDRLGVAVWQDMPCIAANLPGGQWGEWGYDTGWDYPLSDAAKATYYREWGDIIKQLRGYPSILVWVPFNEAWAQFDTPAVVEFTRAQDPTRLINSASGGNSHMCGDILDSHNYPEPVMKFRSGGAQIDVLGEYGGIGCAMPGHLWQPENNWGYKGLYEDGEAVLAR
ncbi:MAG: beta galactosidase jelly roll domain-containing protein, partial [Bacteroidales bacterium]|nr:beta galactosidase jelly roll domain-containing protein [Bacteroidales bacterium]